MIEPAEITAKLTFWTAPLFLILIEFLRSPTMALTVQAIYNSLSIYRVKLLAGKEGLLRNVSWVYYTEDPETIEFIRGGELAVTTCLNIERHAQNTGTDSKTYIVEFLSEMINAFVDRNAAGLIINVGKFIDSIPPEICSLCDRLSFPLFSMPWEIHTIDVMQEVGNKIAMENQKRYTVEQCMYDAIFYKKKLDVSSLKGSSFLNSEKYSVTIMEYPDYDFNDDEDEMRRYLEYSFIPKSRINQLECCWFFCDRKIVFVIKNSPDEFAQKLNTAAKKDKYFSKSKVAFSNTCSSIYDLDSEYKHAELALKLCEDLYCDYNSLGFYKILAEIKDKTVLENMYNQVLGKLDVFSEQKRDSYIDTLRIYIEANGKIQKTADENYTHRNTVNYRINKISEILGVNIQNGEARFLIQTAIYIKKYLTLID